jgi:hypothetical protein
MNKSSQLSTLSESELRSVNGGTTFWEDFWDGVYANLSKDMKDFADGFHDGVHNP